MMVATDTYRKPTSNGTLHQNDRTIGQQREKGRMLEMKRTQLSIRLSSVCPLLILIPLLSACQSYPQPSPLQSEEDTRLLVQQAGSSALHPDEAEENVAGDADPSDQPSLLGYTIGDPKAAVATVYGKAQAQYTMEDGSEEIHVHRYPGFNIGFSEYDAIHFIDIYSSEVDPQLSGLKIGSSVDDVLRVLGEPQHLTDAVMMYTQNNLILKLDIDHTTMSIVSIKLFASTN